MVNLIILLLVWCAGIVLCYAWYLAAFLHRAFREEAVVEPMAARPAVEPRPGDMLSYARPPRTIGFSRRWPVFQVILGSIVVVLPMAIPVGILLGLGITDSAPGLQVPCGLALGLMLLAVAAVAWRGLRDRGGRPAAANWRYLGWAVLSWVGLMVLTWGLLEWRVQRMMDATLARADALGKEIEVVSANGSEAAALYTKAGVMPSGQLQFDDQWELITAEGRMAPPPPFPEAHAFRIPLLRKAAAMEVNGFVAPASSYSVDTLLPYLAGMRQAAMLLHRHALSEARAGRIASAIDDINAMHGMANQAAQGLCLVEVLVGTGIHALADNALQHVLPMVVDPRDLDRIGPDGPTPPMATMRRAVLGELGVGDRRSIVMVLRRQTSLAFTSVSSGKNYASPPSGIMPVYRVLLGERDLAHAEQCVSVFPALIPDDPAAAAAGSSWLNTFTMAAQHQTPVAGLLVPALGRSVDRQVALAAMADLSRAAVAATRFRLQQKRLPTSFDELVQARLLPAIPIDPFNGKPMCFAAHEGYVFIYTIGTSRANGGGTPYIAKPNGSVVESNPGFILSARPLWELDLVPPGAIAATTQPAPATQAAQ